MELALDDYMIHSVRNSDSDLINMYLNAKDDGSWTPRYTYRLYGVVSHSGNMGGGHYINYVCYEYEGKRFWLYMSDSYVD